MREQIKKTFAILLVICFVMSVTAAAVSAAPNMHQKNKTGCNNQNNGKKMFNTHDSKKNLNKNSYVGYNGNEDGNGNTGYLNGILNGNTFGDNCKIIVYIIVHNYTFVR